MSTTAAIVAGSIAGIGGAYYLANQGQKQANSQLSYLQNLNSNYNQNALDTLPTEPAAPETGENEEANAAREAQEAALAANEAAVNPTGGQGLGSPANTKKKTLGGV